MKVAMLSVVGGRAVMVGKGYMEVSDDLLQQDVFTDEMEEDIGEEMWNSIKEFLESGNEVQVFVHDEVDFVLGRSEENYIEMKETLGGVFCEEYDSENLWKKISKLLDEMNWEQELQVVL